MILPKIDYHSHILPCIDDGAESVKKSIMMLEKAKQYGIQAIYATPHCYMHKTNVDMFCEMRKGAYEKIKDEVSNIPIFMGAEVLLFPGLENLPELEKFCLENSNSLLIEMPLSESLITEEHFVSAHILSKRFSVIIAHANRYSDAVVQRLLESDVKLQLNVSDVCKKSERKRTEKWLYADAVCALGSDAHRDAGVYKKFDKAYKILNSF